MVVQIASHAMIAARYESKLTAAEIGELQSLLESHHFTTLTLPNRPGVSDEAHPSITLEAKTGASHTVQKWANDKNADFDPIYEKLRHLSKRAESTKPVFEGEYDWNWMPEKG